MITKTKNKRPRLQRDVAREPDHSTNVRRGERVEENGPRTNLRYTANARRGERVLEREDLW